MYQGGYGGQNYYGGQPAYNKGYGYPTQNYGSYGHQGGYSYGGSPAAQNCLLSCCGTFCGQMAAYICCDCLTPGGFFWSNYCLLSHI